METNRSDFDGSAQDDLLGAAVRLYEAEKYDLCMSILHLLMENGNKEAYVLAGHCASVYNDELNVANAYYKSSCQLGSAVGCYNLFLNYSNIDQNLADSYLERAKVLGWVE